VILEERRLQMSQVGGWWEAFVRQGLQCASLTNVLWIGYEQDIRNLTRSDVQQF